MEEKFVTEGQESYYSGGEEIVSGHILAYQRVVCFVSDALKSKDMVIPGFRGYNGFRFFARQH